MSSCIGFLLLRWCSIARKLVFSIERIASLLLGTLGALPKSHGQILKLKKLFSVIIVFIGIIAMQPVMLRLNLKCLLYNLLCLVSVYCTLTLLELCLIISF